MFPRLWKRWYHLTPFALGCFILIYMSVRRRQTTLRYEKVRKDTVQKAERWMAILQEAANTGEEDPLPANVGTHLESGLLDVLLRLHPLEREHIFRNVLGKEYRRDVKLARFAQVLREKLLAFKKVMHLHGVVGKSPPSVAKPHPSTVPKRGSEKRIPKKGLQKTPKKGIGSKRAATYIRYVKDSKEPHNMKTPVGGGAKRLNWMQQQRPGTDGPSKVEQAFTYRASARRVNSTSAKAGRHQGKRFRNENGNKAGMSVGENRRINVIRKNPDEQQKIPSMTSLLKRCSNADNIKLHVVSPSLVARLINASNSIDRTETLSSGSSIEQLAIHAAEQGMLEFAIVAEAHWKLLLQTLRQELASVMGGNRKLFQQNKLLLQKSHAAIKLVHITDDRHRFFWFYFTRVQKFRSAYKLPKIPEHIGKLLEFDFKERRTSKFAMNADLRTNRLIDIVYFNEIRYPLYPETVITAPVDGRGYLVHTRSWRFVRCSYEEAKNNRETHKIPFSELSLRKSILNLLAHARRNFAHFGMRVWLQGGSLLGWYRQCDILPNSTDADLQANITELTGREIIDFYNRSNDIFLFWQLGALDDLFELSIWAERKTVDVFFTYNNLTHSWIGEHLYTQKEKYKLVYPYANLTLCSTELWGELQLVPCEKRVVETILESDYGRDWRTPLGEGQWDNRPNMFFDGRYSDDEARRLYVMDYKWRFSSE